MAGTIWPNLVAGARAKASEIEAKFEWLEGDLVPMFNGTKVTNTYDLGTANFKWRYGYISNTLYLGSGSLTNPSIAIGNASSTGWYFNESEMGFVTNGENKFKFISNASFSCIAVYGVTGSSFSWGVNDSAKFIISPTTTGSPVYFSLNTTGVISFPYNTYFFSYITSASNITGKGAVYTVTGYTNYTDVGSNFSDATGIFRVPEDGKYFVSSQMYYGQGATDATMTTLRLDLYANDVIVANTFHRPRPIVGVTYGISLSGIFELSAGDEVCLVMTGDGSDTNGVDLSALGTFKGTYFSMYKVA